MENSYFVFSDTELNIKRFHVCSWEFGNNTSLIEFGFEISGKSVLNKSKLSIKTYIPWLNNNLEPMDLYGNLKIADNSKFIFNDYVKESFDLNPGIIHNFSQHGKLCFLPITFDPINNDEKTLSINVDLFSYNNQKFAEDIDIYLRFYLEPDITTVSTRKKGVGSSTIIYDVKLNQLRNLPELLKNNIICKIDSCFCLNIIPNSYDIHFFDTTLLKSVRKLEYHAFKKYLPDKRVKDEEYLVLFNKKTSQNEKENNFHFFIIFKKERIGTGQFALAILINLLSGMLLSFPAYRKDLVPNTTLAQNLPFEFWLAILVGLGTLIYFFIPYIKAVFYYLYFE